MKVYFKKVKSEPLGELKVYSSLNPIPFTFKLKSSNRLPETIYTRNLSGENFIEFRFNKTTKQLYEITLVAIQPDTVKPGGDNHFNNDDLFECYIDDNCELSTSNPVQILRTDRSLHFFWGKQPSKAYAITKNCILGVYENNNLCSLSLLELNENLIYKILGG